MAGGSVDAGAVRWDDKDQRWLRWSGRRWGKAAHSARPEELREQTPFTDLQTLSASSRGRLLDRALDAEVLEGATVLQRQPHSAILSFPVPVSHGVHLVLTILTFGFWAVVWIVMCLTRTQDRYRFVVDEWGHIWREEPTSSPRQSS